MAQLNQRFEALEDQLDLPAQPITLQHLFGRGSILGQGGEYQDITGILPIFGRVAVSARLLPARQSPMGPLDGFLALPNPAQTSRDALLAGRYPAPPFRRLARFPQRLEPLPQGERPISFIP